MSKARVLLFGVKMTLNRLAVKDELVWQVFKEVDSINRVAETPESNGSEAARMPNGDDNIEDLIVRVVC